MKLKGNSEKQQNGVEIVLRGSSHFLREIETTFSAGSAKSILGPIVLLFLLLLQKSFAWELVVGEGVANSANALGGITGDSLQL